jgi:hypothetical protein
MTQRLVTICLLTGLSMAVFSPSIQAQDSSPFASTLKDISAVFVVVEKLPDGAKILGLTKETIQTDVELKLLLAGMGVTTLEEGKKLPGRPFVFVNVNMTNNAKAANITVELDQDALLARNGKPAPSLQTWSTVVLLTNADAQAIRDAVKDLVDKFLNAWLSVNPQK